ncbi:MAG: type II toxin-antitoxin system YafQ family toxin [Nitrospirae bacterium]|nr:type II toxin-antitoxin system YafQ family toxin [Nitrospirota bacterium]
MVLKVQRTTKFKKDYKRMQKSDKDMEKFREIMRKLQNEEALDPKHNDHPLTGEFKDSRDCHIEPDWVLIYRVAGDTICFERTGSHSDLFG